MQRTACTFTPRGSCISKMRAVRITIDVEGKGKLARLNLEGNLGFRLWGHGSRLFC
jgi:hypothetical protein